MNDAPPPETPTDAPPPPAPSSPAAAFDAAFAGDNWRERLAWKRDRDGEFAGYLAILRNVVTILQEHRAWRGLLAFDEFSGRVVKLREPPYPGGAGEWSDYDDASLVLWLSVEFGVEPKDQVMLKAVQIVAERNRYHEVRQYLQGLKWDQSPRLSYWLQAWAGAGAKPGTDHERYVQAVGRKWMIAAVARIMRPGCKADNVLILEGPQGSLKSTAARTLAGSWFTDAPLKLGDREASMIIRGRWIVELSELDSLNKAESSTAKAFFSQNEDRYRSPWGKRPADVARQCVFIGSVNHAQYLRDDTGARRYWPVRCGEIDIPGLREARDQLWAEAMAAYLAGEPWWLLPEDRALFGEQQDQRYIGDAWQDQILIWLAENYRSEVSTSELLGHALKLDMAKWTRADQMRVAAIMARMGWERRRSSEKGADGVRPWIYRAPVLPVPH